MKSATYLVNRRGYSAEDAASSAIHNATSLGHFRFDAVKTDLENDTSIIRDLYALSSE